LLVVIGIIAALVGLLIPAIFKAKLAVSRISSGNKLHQMGIAAANYQSSNGVMPRRPKPFVASSTVCRAVSVRPCCPT